MLYVGMDVAKNKHDLAVIDEIQAQIDDILTQINSPILSIPGMEQRLGAIILAESRNIDNLSSPVGLQAFTGLELSIYQSGQIDNSGRMVKLGSHYHSSG